MSASTATTAPGRSARASSNARGLAAVTATGSPSLLTVRAPSIPNSSNADLHTPECSLAV